MLVEKIVEGGRRKRVERRITATCLTCGQALACPADVEPWGWVKSEATRRFLDEHISHRRAGIHVELVEIDDEDEG